MWNIYNVGIKMKKKCNNKCINFVFMYYCQYVKYVNVKRKT
jgi:hypothetical protein